MEILPKFYCNNWTSANGKPICRIQCNRCKHIVKQKQIETQNLINKK